MTAKAAYRLSGWRRIAARFGLAGLLLQAIFPLLLLGVAPAAASSPWDQIVLCTSDGPKTVSLADLPGSDLPPTPDQTSHLPYCPACPGYFQAYAAITPPAVLAAGPRRVEILHFAPAEQRGPEQRRHSPQSARAPPAFA